MPILIFREKVVKPCLHVCNISNTRKNLMRFVFY